MKTTLATIGILAGTLALGWIFTGNNLAMFKVFAPKYEQARRETFEQAKAHRQCAIQELQNMQFQYEQAEPAHKAALASIIFRRAADFQDLPADLRGFVQSLNATQPFYIEPRVIVSPFRLWNQVELPPKGSSESKKERPSDGIRRHSNPNE